MELTSDEEKLLKCAEIGFPFLGVNATIRARVIRDIATGTLAVNADPSGVNVAGAKITGALILLGVSTDLMLHFKGCTFDKTLLATGARIPAMRFEHCEFRPATGAAIGAEGLRVSGGFTLHDCLIEAKEPNTAVDLDNAEIGGHLSIQRTSIINPEGQCLSGHRAKIGSNLTLAGLRAKSGAAKLGAVRFSIAEIGGKVNLTEGTSIEAIGGPAVVFDARRFGDTFHAIGVSLVASQSEEGTFRVDGVDIGSQIVLSCCGIDSESSVAISADRLRVHGSVMVGPMTWIRGVGERGALRLMGARVDGNVSFDNTAIFNGTGPVIAAETMVVDGHLRLNGGLHVEGVDDEGVISTGRRPRGPASSGRRSRNR